MKAEIKNSIVEFSTNYSHIIQDNKTLTLEEYADKIESHYKSDKNRTADVCRWLRGTEGTIVRNRLGKTFLRYKKHKD